MAATSLLALLDDIATVLDDISLMTKVAAKKTAGVLGDDLAVNAEQVSGVRPDRELPVVWAVARGSLINKLILVPAALAISALLPWLIVPLLMLGGLYLCYEGMEKLFHSPAKDPNHHAELQAALAQPGVDLVALEQTRIRGAIRTDFVLSAEIIVIALGTVVDASFGMQVAVVSGIALIMTAGVYGLVAGIVKLDDAGLFLSRRAGQGLWRRLQRGLGRGMLNMAPYLMKTLSVVGTVAMFLVGGGILTHGVHRLQAGLETLAARSSEVAVVGGLLKALVPLLLNGLAGMIAGAVVLGGVTLVRRIRSGAGA